MAAPISRKRKCVAQGVFKAELNEFLTRELAEDGYSGFGTLFALSTCVIFISWHGQRSSFQWRKQIV